MAVYNYVFVIKAVNANCSNNFPRFIVTTTIVGVLKCTDIALTETINFRFNFCVVQSSNDTRFLQFNFFFHLAY